MMQWELPQYIQNMFMAAGYKTLETIAEMNVSRSSGPNDIGLHCKNFPKDARLVLVLS